ncbi:hypothetical protein ACS0PU_009283 [Formica fusca]
MQYSHAQVHSNRRESRSDDAGTTRTINFSASLPRGAYAAPRSHVTARNWGIFARTSLPLLPRVFLSPRETERWHDATHSVVYTSRSRKNCKRRRKALTTTESVVERKSAKSLHSRIGPVTESSSVHW